jgi:hypothetical protein
MESVFVTGDPEAATDKLLAAISAKKHCQKNCRAAQRNRRSSQDTAERDLIREQDSGACRVAWGLLDNGDREQIRIADIVAHTASCNTEVQCPNHWWE